MDQLGFVSGLCGHVFCEGGESFAVKRASISSILVELGASGDVPDSFEMRYRVDVLLAALAQAVTRLNN